VDECHRECMGISDKAEELEALLTGNLLKRRAELQDIITGAPCLASSHIQSHMMCGVECVLTSCTLPLYWCIPFSEAFVLFVSRVQQMGAAVVAFPSIISALL
jgi:hypothetical protein